MSLRIEDYALISDTETGALVGNDGSIDWLCFPRYDSGACFAGLLGEPSHGRWLLAPVSGVRAVRRRYRPDTLVLETEIDADGGTVRLVDFMPRRDQEPNLVRIVEGVRGRVDMRMDLVIRFDYGSIVPWVRRVEGALVAIGGPDALCIRSPVPTRGENMTTVAEFSVGEGDRLPFQLHWFPSNQRNIPRAVDPDHALRETENVWRKWTANSTYDGDWNEAVVRSLLTLKALTYAPTGGIVAAATTSLPEALGGVRNWDYRFCWLRDATFTLQSLLASGFEAEARSWRDWLLRAIAGDPSQFQIMYGPAGERRLTEVELPWLPGYEGSKPVRIGNGAVNQFQLDVYGEVMDAMHQASRSGIDIEAQGWAVQNALMDFLESNWDRPDEGIWEIRGPRRHFTHSKVMAWVAADRAVRGVEQFGLEGSVDQWRALRSEIHADVLEHGYDADRGSFVQYYGSKDLDASLLMIPLVGFLPPSDDRVRNTAEAIERELTEDGFVLRYRQGDRESVDGLPGREGAFLACTFWLADNFTLLGRSDDARRTFERLLGLANDVGLLSEEYDVSNRRLVGNFPQAFSHVALVNTAANISHDVGPVDHRRGHHHS